MVNLFPIISIFHLNSKFNKKICLTILYYMCIIKSIVKFKTIIIDYVFKINKKSFNILMRYIKTNQFDKTLSLLMAKPQDKILRLLIIKSKK